MPTPRTAMLFMLLLSACNCDGDRPTSDARVNDMGGDAEPCTPGSLSCAGNNVTMCGSDEIIETCVSPQICVEGQGCGSCVPGQNFCQGNDVFACNADGTPGDRQEECGQQICNTGICVDECAMAAADLSTVGCDYFAVDLDVAVDPVAGDGSAKQFAVVIANPNNREVLVTVEQNDAPLGSAPSVTVLQQVTCPANDLVQINLPRREVDGTTPALPDGEGSFFSSNAYRIKTNFPVVAYQFNPITQEFSNDASLLLPVPALGNKYRVLNWPTFDVFPDFIPFEFPPWRGFLTIVGTEAGTVVQVNSSTMILAGGTVEASDEGAMTSYNLGPFDVLNLASTGSAESLTNVVAGDHTGTVITSNKPVAVFSGVENTTIGVEIAKRGAPTHPNWDSENSCCQDRLEEQLFPVEAQGQAFAITRSPVRGSGWREPDVYRIIADKNGTSVTTSLPGADAQFTLQENEWREFYAQDGFSLEASAPISIAQYIVSGEFVTDNIIGDPAMILFPPVEQYQTDYVFLSAPTFATNFVSIAAPTSGASIMLDGNDVLTASNCVSEDVGTVSGTEYVSYVCEISGGTHRVNSDVPVGITVYGYHSAGSYGYAGGSGLERINPLI